MAERLAASALPGEGKASVRTRAGDAPGQAGAYPSRLRRAGLGIRLVAYLLDSVVLFAFTMLFASAAFLNIFLRSDYGEENASDAAIWTSVAILMATVPAWLVANLALGLKRGQSMGQYVLGLRVVTEEGEGLSLLRLLAYWLALHPLLFHPMLAAFWLLLSYVSLALSENLAAVIASLAVALLCLLGPLGGLLFAFIDPQRRAIHDRLAGTKVVHLD